MTANELSTHGDIEDPLSLVRDLLRSSPTPQVGVLATVGDDLAPHARSVLVELVGEDLAIGTDGRSAKVADIERDRRVCLVLYWPLLNRQAVLQGEAVRLDRTREAELFGRRPDHLKVLAWLNDADFASLEAAERERRFQEFSARHERSPLEPPPWWVGYRIDVSTMLWWCGEDKGPSYRTAYRRTPQGWEASSLPG